MADDKLVQLRHLELSAMQSAAMIDNKIVELAAAMSEDLAELQSEVDGLAGGGSSGISVKADWQQNDETAPDYVKNRTHYINIESVEILPEFEVDGDYIDLYDVEIFSKLSPDAECSITIDGTVYKAIAHHFTYNAYEWYVIGNSDLVGEGGGVDAHLPFGIFIDKYNENWGMCDRDVSTIKIEAVTETVVKIPEIYLPAKIGNAGTGSYSEIFNNLSENIASGDYSRAENFKTTASGYASNAQGINSVASGYGAHAEGCSTEATSPYSHSEGYNTVASGNYSHAEGQGTISKGENQHVSGSYNVEDTTSLVIVGNGSGTSSRSNAYRLNKNGDGYFSGSVYVGADNKKLATEELVNTKASKNVSGQVFIVDGVEKTAAPDTAILGDYAKNIAIGQWSLAEGSETRAIGRASHAEGALTQAISDGSHVEGYGTKATGYWSHAEGEMTVVSSYASHAEGSYTKMPDGSTRYSTAAGYASHTEGGGCHTNGVASHAEGIGTTANGRCAHVEGIYNIASGKAQHVEGIANIEDTGDKYIHIAGNGISPTDRSNAYTLDWNGNGWFAGTVQVNAIILRSSTEGSTKTFKLTIDDSGELSITENG